MERKEITKFVRNEFNDGWMPVCPQCGEDYKDGATGEVKNYPDDGKFVVFMYCERCQAETGEVSMAWNPVKP